ncbi:MAG TPA: flippase activity-associated protein Agl23 [Dehalococcoidia bacterium]|nr:flippase activity-associated protein Agl23 [Dehalococcoidia bacterium]
MIARPKLPLRLVRPGWFTLGILGLMLLALGLRLWELGGRAMHYDEAIHVHYAWRLAVGEGYIHSPWMHGPFQIEATALIFRLLGDTDFTARLLYVIFGAALVGLPWFLREQLGRAGALMAAAMMALSPALLYFSRFGRNDILMAFWALALLVLLWRYLVQGKDRYLYLASAVLALMFATKETAYIVALTVGAVLFLLALPDLVPLALGRRRLAGLGGAAGFLVLLVTLTLPQWSALAALFQGILGLTLATPDGAATGIVGGPQWAAPFISLPVLEAPRWFHGLAAVLLVAGLLLLNHRRGRELALATGVVVPLLGAAVAAWVLFHPLRNTQTWAGAMIADWLVALGLASASVAILLRRRYPWKRGAALILGPVVLMALYAALFTPIANVSGLVNAILPAGVGVDTPANLLPVNFLAAGAAMLVALLVSGGVGIAWRGGVWLACAAIFYGVWVTLYTTWFANWAGLFSGSWQGMGYWVAQQEVARGNQPWYYYLVGLSVYELLPAVFGVLGAGYFLKKGDVFGLVLAAWSGLTLLAYTLASEKMPWLLVNVTLPFILLAGKYLGALVEQVRWRRVLRQGQALLLVLPPLGAAAAVYFLYGYTASPDSLSLALWDALLAAALLALASAYLLGRQAVPGRGVALLGLGMAALLLGLGAWGAFRVAYTFDDSNKEVMVYAQGSADLPATVRELTAQGLLQPGQAGVLAVDYDLWYPLQWYLRHHQRDGLVRWACFKSEGEAGWNAGCNPPKPAPDAAGFLLTAEHQRAVGNLEGYRQAGPFRNLLWFPETYRRPAENRQAEGPGQELVRDLAFFREAASSRRAWHSALNYLLFRGLEQDWFNSEYYTYLRESATASPATTPAAGSDSNPAP